MLKGHCSAMAFIHHMEKLIFVITITSVYYLNIYKTHAFTLFQQQRQFKVQYSSSHIISQTQTEIQTQPKNYCNYDSLTVSFLQSDSNAQNNDQTTSSSSSSTTSAPTSKTTARTTINHLKSPNQIPLLLPSPKCNPTQMSPTSLAYIGDVVFEMFARCRYVWPTRRTSDLQNVVVAKVRAETQSKVYQKILSSSSFTLTPEEKIIISRGRNAGGKSKKKSRVPKRLTQSAKSNSNEVGGGPEIYQDSTAFEALIGYMYLTDGERCNDLLEFVCEEFDHMDGLEGIVR